MQNKGRNLSVKPSVLSLSIVLSLSGAMIPSFVEAKTYTFRVGSGHPVAGLSHMEALDEQYLPEIAKRVEEETDHKIRWIKAYSGALVKLPETLSATQKGLVDIGVINYPHIAELSVHNFPFHLPFQTGDAVMATKAVRATFDKVPWLTENFEQEFNQKMLAIGANGNYSIGTTFPFQKVEELRGKKIGAGGPNQLWFEGTGSTPVTTTLGDAYNALSSGIYDGLVIFPGPYFGFNLHEVGKNFTMTNFGSPSALSINMNLDKWNSLPPEIQTIFKEESAKYEVYNSELANKADADGLESLKNAGTNIIYLPIAEQAKWSKGLADYPNRQAQMANEKGAPGSEIYSTYIQELKKLGYNWPYEYKIQ